MFYWTLSEPTNFEHLLVFMILRAPALTSSLAMLLRRTY